MVERSFEMANLGLEAVRQTPMDPDAAWLMDQLFQADERTTKMMVESKPAFTCLPTCAENSGG